MKSTEELFEATLARAVSNMDTMEMPFSIIEYTLVKNGLRYYLEYFNDNSTSHQAPYHNRYHTYCMVGNCYEAAVTLGLSEDQTRSLLAAALMHDANHSQGKWTDDLNVAEAVRFFNEAHEHVLKIIEDDNRPLTPAELVQSIDTLKITKYPYEGPPITLLQKIIRDADLMQVYESDLEQLARQFLGLKQEMEVAQQRTYTKEEWADGCFAFNAAVTWHTIWALKKKSLLPDANETLRNVLRTQD